VAIPSAKSSRNIVVDVLLLVGVIAGAIYALRLVGPSSSEIDTKDD